MITHEHKLRYLKILLHNMECKVANEPRSEFKDRMQSDVNIVSAIINDYQSMEPTCKGE